MKSELTIEELDVVSGGFTAVFGAMISGSIAAGGQVSVTNGGFNFCSGGSTVTVHSF
jgi:hypothetical protein